MSIKLHLCAPRGNRRVLELPPSSALIIGRGDGSHVKLPDPMLSTAHLKVSHFEDDVSVTDLSRGSGTFINGSKINHSVSLNNGDEILAGATRIFVADKSLASKRPVNGAIHADLECLTGTWLSKFYLKRVLGVGTTGVVFEAYDQQRQRNAAFKVYSKRYTSNNSRKNQLIAGAQAFSKLKGPHLVRLYQFGKNSASYYYAAMKLIQGDRLSQVIQNDGVESMLPWQEAWRCAVHIAMALATIHNSGLVHRNVSPSNIIFNPSSRDYHLGDFSTASFVAPDQFADASGLSDSERFRAPESLTSLDGDLLQSSSSRSLLTKSVAGNICSDIFGLGAVCFAMLTGQPPEKDLTGSELDSSVQLSRSAPIFTHQSVDERFQSVILKMLNHNPARRYQTPQLLLKDLNRVGKINGLQH